MAEWTDDLKGLSAAEQFFRMADAARVEGDEPGQKWATEAIIGGLMIYRETFGDGGAYQGAITTQPIPRSVADEARQLARRRRFDGTALAERA